MRIDRDRPVVARATLAALLACVAPAAADDSGAFVRVGAGGAWQRVNLHDDDGIYGTSSGGALLGHVSIGGHISTDLVLHGDYARARQDDPVIRAAGVADRLGGTLTWQALGVGLTCYPGGGGGFAGLGVVLAKGRRETDDGRVVESDLSFGMQGLVGYELALGGPFALGAAGHWAWLELGVDDENPQKQQVRHLTLGGLLFVAYHAR